MAEEKKHDKKDDDAYRGSKTQHQLGQRSRFRYEAIADWVVLRKREKPIARVFHVAYLKKGRAQRPLTFVFNGGPGAASAYLHMGALGPKRAVFNEDGSLPRPPARLVDNAESWLPFTDLVFVDPVGTGFSRTVEEEAKGDEKKKDGDDKPNAEFWEVDRDLESLGEFMQKFLSAHNRWTAPIFIAGESYGGFRVAKLARLVQERYGIGLSGAILISPAIEFASLMGSDYNLMHWVEILPSMAATAWVHNREHRPKRRTSLAAYLREAEAFALGDFLPLIAGGGALDEGQKGRVLRRMARLVGLDEELVTRSAGRVERQAFARGLLREERRYCGLYDASLTAIDPFPDRTGYEGPDPTLAAIDRVFRSVINAHLREGLEVETDLDYELLSYEVNQNWKPSQGGFIRPQIGAMDDLRYGMVLNPHMQVCISHGFFDLVTPYFSSNRLVEHMKLDESLQGNLRVQHYLGGHMFYTWEASRKAFAKDMVKLYRDAV